MILIAVLLLAAVGAATAGVIVGANGNVVFDNFNESITASGPWVFAFGAACGLVAALALWIGRLGARRNRLRRRQMRTLRKERDREQADLAREREELHAERERLNASQPPDEAESEEDEYATAKR
jgi:hypothetical protein